MNLFRCPTCERERLTWQAPCPSCGSPLPAYKVIKRGLVDWITLGICAFAIVYSIRELLLTP